MAVFKNSRPFGNIVTDGLVLNLDATNINSYSGVGNNWFDTSGNGNNGTLTNGPTFLRERKCGTIVFDGVNDYVDTINVSTYTNLTFNLWLYDLRNSNTAHDILKYGFGNDGSFTLFGDSTNAEFGSFRTDGNGAAARRFLNVPIPTQRWYNLCYIKNGNLYINSISYNGTGTDRTYDKILLGYSRTDVNVFWQGYMSILQIYNRALSPSEVLQNYNATKTRFGL